MIQISAAMDMVLWEEEMGIFIYAITRDGRVLKIDTTNNSHCFVGNSIDSDNPDRGWDDANLGIDGCIYWPPFNAHRSLKYDRNTNQASLVGNDFGKEGCKWSGGPLTSDGAMYYFPLNNTRIMSIDPLKEYKSSLENTMVRRPEQLGCIFKPSDDMLNNANYDPAVIKFGCTCT